MQVGKKQTAQEKYHRAAIDGYVDMLCDASKKDTNTPLTDGSRATPTLLAAQFGQLEALRILVGRGGDPERCASDGSSALHLAAARNHLNCVSFLVNFGVNLWALDNELHTAKDVAAISSDRFGRDSLDYLDCAMAKQSAINTKNVQKLKEKAKLGAEKRLRSVRKAQLKAIKQAEKDEKFLIKLSNQRRLLKAAHSISDIKLVGRGDGAGKDLLVREMFRSNECLDRYDSGTDSEPRCAPKPLSTSVSMSNLAAPQPTRHPKMSSNIISSSSRLFSRKQQQQQQHTGNKQQVPISQPTSAGYFASSVSSISGASLSSGISSVCHTRSKVRIAASGAKSSRPKYSDLVAVSFSPDSCGDDSGASNASSSGAASSSQSSVKSGSTIASRLRAISGVSRKVHLRRLLLPAGASSAQTITAKQQQQQQQLPANESFDQLNDCDSSSSVSLAAAATSVADNRRYSPGGGSPESECATRQQQQHCNVRPANKLKMSGVNTKLASQSQQQQVMPSESPARHKLEHLGETDQHERAPSRCEPPVPPPLPATPLAASSLVTGANYKEASATSYQQQRSLIDQCLSQMKMHTSGNSNHTHNSAGTDGFALNAASNSDELLRHQINAGEFPLRPSLIKQQQLQRQVAAAARTDSQTGSGRNRRQVEPPKSASFSSDSIGSASSLVGEQQASIRTDAAAAAARNLLTLASLSSSSSLQSTPVARSELATSSSPSSSGSAACGKVNLVKRQVDQSANNNNDGEADCQCGQQHQQWQPCDEQLADFLDSNGLADLCGVFARERIDLEALMLLTESDLMSLQILLGPRRKLLNAIERKRKTMARPRGDGAQAEPDVVRHPMFVMVDTQL